jgi:hypothetical protein
MGVLCGRTVRVGRDDAACQTPCKYSRQHRANEEGARPTACERAQFVKQFAGLPAVQPLGQSVCVITRSADEVVRDAGLVAADGHSTEFLAN